MDTILQSEAAECGLACLAMVADHHGYKTDLNQLRQKFPQSLKGLNLQQLINIADKLRLSSRALKLELSHLSKLKLPTILHWDMNHFVVLTAVHKKKIELLDPAIGNRSLSITEFSKHFTGIALELSPSTEFQQQDSRKNIGLMSFYKSIKGINKPLIQLVTLSAFLQIFAMVTPYYMQLVIDEVVISYDQNLLLVLALGFTGVAIFNSIIQVIRNFMVISLGANLNQQLAFNLFHHLIKLPLDFFNKRHIGDIISRFSSLQQLKQMVTTGMVEALIDGVMAIATLVMIFIYNSQLAMVVLASMTIYLIIRLLWYQPLRATSEEAIISTAKEQSNFMENMRGIQTIKLFNIEAKREGLWQNYYIESLNKEVKVESLKTKYQFVNSLLFGLENTLVIYLGAKLIITQQPSVIFTVGMLIAFMAYKGQLTQRFSSLVEKLIEFKMLSLHLNRVSDIALSPIEQDKHHCVFQELDGTISLDNINFRYSTNEPLLLENLNASFRKGKNTAIIGASGNGKSTLIKIMLGLLKPESGQVKINDLCLNKFGITNFRQQVATVMQDDQLFPGTVAENISQFAPKIDIERVMEVAKQANIHKDIMMMPMHYNSLVGDMGSTLSGGQKQRIVLARALYANPKILFLDEATSHLDLNSEKIINKALEQLQITKITIAHREETIAMADDVYELKQGQLLHRKDLEHGCL